MLVGEHARERCPCVGLLAYITESWLRLGLRLRHMLRLRLRFQPWHILSAGLSVGLSVCLGVGLGIGLGVRFALHLV